jgi:hypothetical protein
MATLLSLAALGAIALLWLDGARAREFALGLVAELCQRRYLQLLDGTVALARMGIRRTPSGLRIRRMFRFDYSEEGVGRRTGYLLLLGADVETVIFDPDGDDPESGANAASRDNKVVPLRRPRR